MPVDTTNGFQPLDSEILTIERIVVKLSSLAPRLSFEEFASATVEEFALHNLRVTLLWDVSDPNHPEPQISICGRVNEPHDGLFDHERQTWEVQRDILGIDENPGAMRADGTIESPAQSTAFITKKG